MPTVRPPRSLFARFALLTGLLLALLGALLTWFSARSTEQALLARAQQQAQHVGVALQASLVPHAVAGTWQDAVPAMQRLRAQLGLSYLALQDGGRRTLVTVGRDGAIPLPPVTGDMAQVLAGDVVFHGVAALDQGTETAGFVRYGVSLEHVHAARAQAIRTGIAVTGAVILLGMAVTMVAVLGITRRLRRVGGMLAAVAGGNRPPKLPARGAAEIADLSRAANEAARVIDERFAALAVREARFYAVAECAYHVEAWFNPQGRLVWINRSIERVTGYSPLECVLAGNLIEMLVCQKDRAYAEEEGRKALAGTSGDNLELRLQRKDGSLVWVAVSWHGIHEAKGRYLGLRVSLDDIQARKEAEMRLLETVAELRRAQGQREFYLVRANEERARLGALLDVMKVGVMFSDRNRRVLFCNKALYRIWGVPERATLTGVREETLLERTAPLRAADAAYRQHVAEVLGQTETTAPHEFALTDGRVLRDVSTLVPGEAVGEFIGRVWIYEDITDQTRIADRLIQLAERDPLTNLYNRRRFQEELERMLADAARREVQLGLLVVDLDGFKPINDHFGHQAGDTVLITLAEQVGATVRRNEMFFRIGGDEFALLATDSSEEEMVGLARRILSKITNLRFEFAGEQARLTASVGIALYPVHGRDGRELLEHGDQAMYRAKTSGKNRWQVWRARSAA